MTRARLTMVVVVVGGLGMLTGADEAAAESPKAPASEIVAETVSVGASGADLPRRDHAVSVGLWSLLGLAGVQVQYEQLTGQRRWSWIAGGGFRVSAGGDYRSFLLAAGGEVRYWLRGKALWASAPPRSMIGIYVGARTDVAWTRTSDEVVGRAIGDNLALAVTVTSGYRFLIKRRVEVTPMVGIGVNRDIDLRDRLPSTQRGLFRLGMTAGWLF